MLNQCAAEFFSIASDARSAQEPFWNNGLFGGLDAIALHGMLTQVRPARNLEVVSGNSTKFAEKYDSDPRPQYSHDLD
jgi:hypothetical protein